MPECVTFTLSQQGNFSELTTIDELPSIFTPNSSLKPIEQGKISAPRKAEMDVLCANLSVYKTKSIALSLNPENPDRFILKSRFIPTILDLFEEKNLDLTYPELLSVCKETELYSSQYQIDQIERDMLMQSKGSSFFRH